MKLALLPCEIYHREFDAKFILACHLAATYGLSSLIGYDKHFNTLSEFLSNCSLLEKSCSSIVWKNRIKNVLNKSGETIVSDEEGFNNIDPSSYYTWAARLDSEAASAIDLYACWGNIDFQFFSRFHTLNSKLKILGNCRSDLLGLAGKKLYSDLSSSLETVFGPFLLCVDNFCVEHRDGPYKPPLFAKSEDKNNKAQHEYAMRMEDLANRRQYFAGLIRQSATNNPTLNYVVRPHPCADLRWWSETFWDLRNVYVIYRHNVEPWLHSAKAVISMGCTTGIQAIVAGTPVIEIKPEYSTVDANIGYAHKYTKFNVENLDQLENSIHLSLTDPGQCFEARDLIESDWKNSLTNCASAVFADQFHRIASPHSNSFDENMRIIERYSGLMRKHPLVPKSTKWLQTPLTRLNQLHRRVIESFSLKPVKVSKVCNDLFLVSP